VTTTLTEATEALPRPQRVRSVLGNQFVGAALLAVLVAIAWQILSGLTFVIPSPVQT